MTSADDLCWPMAYYPPMMAPSVDWIVDSLRERGRVLTGRMGHWCEEWDGLTIDESCPEWPCGCFPS
jgi:hypothetical protein